MLIASVIFLVLFAITSSIDGWYFHLHKYKLHTRSESTREHIAHTIRAFLFAPIVYIFFAANHAGWLLWLGVLIVLADFLVETWDVLLERTSRAGLGGLSTAEYWVHVYAITFRVAALTFAIASKPAAAWHFAGPTTLPEPYPILLVIYAWATICFTIIAAIQHAWYLMPQSRLQ